MSARLHNVWRNARDVISDALWTYLHLAVHRRSTYQRSMRSAFELGQDSVRLLPTQPAGRTRNMHVV